MSSLYTERDLRILSDGFSRGKDMSQLEAELGRSAVAILNKLVALSREEPHKWPKRRTREYIGIYLPQFFERYKEEWREEVLSYLRENPDAVWGDFVRDGLYNKLRMAFGGRINDARRELGIKERRPEPKEVRRQRLIDYILEHPNASLKDIVDSGLSEVYGVYRCRLNNLRRDAGLLKGNHVSGAEAAKRLGVSRQYVSQLFNENKISGYRLGHNIFISVKSINRIKQARS